MLNAAKLVFRMVTGQSVAQLINVSCTWVSLETRRRPVSTEKKISLNEDKAKEEVYFQSRNRSWTFQILAKIDVAKIIDQSLNFFVETRCIFFFSFGSWSSSVNSVMVGWVTETPLANPRCQPAIELIGRGTFVRTRSWTFQSSIENSAFFWVVHESRGLWLSASSIN